MWIKPSRQGEAKQGSIHWAGHKIPDPETLPGKGLGQQKHREWRRQYTQPSSGTQRKCVRE